MEASLASPSPCVFSLPHAYAVWSCSDVTGQQNSAGEVVPVGPDTYVALPREAATRTHTHPHAHTFVPLTCAGASMTISSGQERLRLSRRRLLHISH